MNNPETTIREQTQITEIRHATSYKQLKNIVVMRKSLQTWQHGTKNVKTHTRTIQITLRNEQHGRH